MPVVHCPACSGQVEQTPALAGQIVACPYCQQPMQMPAVPMAKPAVVSGPAKFRKATSSRASGCYVAFGCLGTLTVALIALVAMCSSLPRVAEEMGKKALADAEQKRAEAAKKEAERPRPSEATQAERKQLLEQLIAQGLIAKIEQPAKLPHVYVRPAFYLLDFDDKERICKVVCAFYFELTPQTKIDDGHLCVLYDVQTNKKVGRYSYFTGLSMF